MYEKVIPLRVVFKPAAGRWLCVSIRCRTPMGKTNSQKMLAKCLVCAFERLKAITEQSRSADSDNGNLPELSVSTRKVCKDFGSGAAPGALQTALPRGMPCLRRALSTSMRESCQSVRQLSCRTAMERGKRMIGIDNQWLAASFVGRFCSKSENGLWLLVFRGGRHANY